MIFDMKFFSSIFDSTNMVTTELVEENNKIFRNKEDGDIDLFKQYREDYSFSGAIKIIEKINGFNSFHDAIRQKTKYKIVIIGRGVANAYISNISVLRKFKSMFRVLDSKTTMYLYMNELNQMSVDYCYTEFYKRPEVLDRQISTYWDQYLVEEMSKFVSKNDGNLDYEDQYHADIFMHGSIDGLICNVQISPYGTKHQLLEDDSLKWYDRFPFHFRGTIDMENGTHYFTDVDPRDIRNKRPYDKANLSYFKRL